MNRLIFFFLFRFYLLFPIELCFDLFTLRERERRTLIGEEDLFIPWDEMKKGYFSEGRETFSLTIDDNEWKRSEKKKRISDQIFSLSQDDNCRRE